MFQGIPDVIEGLISLVCVILMIRYKTSKGEQKYHGPSGNLPRNDY